MGEFGKNEEFDVCMTCWRTPPKDRRTLLVCDLCSRIIRVTTTSRKSILSLERSKSETQESRETRSASSLIHEFGRRMFHYKSHGYDAACSTVNEAICWTFFLGDEIRAKPETSKSIADKKKATRDTSYDEDDTINVANLPVTTKEIFIIKGLCGVYDTQLSCVVCGDTTSIYRQCFLACDRCVLMSQEHKFLEIGNHAGGFVQFRVYDPDEDTEYGGMPITLEEFGKRLQHYRDLKYTLSAGVVDQVISWTCTETEESRDEERGDLDVFG